MTLIVIEFMFESNTNEEHQDVLCAYFNAVKHLYEIKESLKNQKYIKNLTVQEITLLRSYQQLASQLITDISDKIS